jgi:hypothetical protein
MAINQLLIFIKTLKMKTMTNYFSPIAKTLVCALTLTSIFSSCKKDKDVVYPPVVKPAVLTLVHAAAGVAELDFYVDKDKANAASFAYNTTILDLKIAKPGKKELSVTKKGVADILVKLPVEFKEDKAYSAFVTDKTASTIVFVEDDLSAPAADKAKIRFINLSADAGILDLAITGKAEALIAKKDFKEFSPFIAAEPGAEINFEIRANGAATVLATLPKVKIEKGKIYTIWAKGLKTAPAANALALAVMANK